MRDQVHENTAAGCVLRCRIKRHGGAPLSEIDDLSPEAATERASGHEFRYAPKSNSLSTTYWDARCHASSTTHNNRRTESRRNHAAYGRKPRATSCSVCTRRRAAIFGCPVACPLQKEAEIAPESGGSAPQNVFTDTLELIRNIFFCSRGQPF